MRSAVGFVVGISAVLSLACSNATTPIADSRVERDVTVPPGAIPYITGVHVAAIPAFDDPAFSVTAFNDIGEIVGDSSNNVTFTSTVFRWTADRGFKFLNLAGDTLSNASALSVNDRAQVAIQVTHVGSATNQAAIWNWQGDVRVLRPLGAGFGCVPSSINDLGVLVGTCTDPSGSPNFPTVWTPFGTPVGLLVGGGGQPIQGSATSISDAGFIAGQTTFAGYVFTPTKQLIPLPPTNASIPNRQSTGVNDSGWVAGQIFDPNVEHDEPAVWTHGDSLHLVYGTGEGNMADISDDGIAVGTVADTVAGVNVPVIWTAAHGLQRLPGLEHSNLLSKESGGAGAINKVHQIIGTITLSTGQTRVVIWTLPDSPMLAARLAARMPRPQ